MKRDTLESTLLKVQGFEGIKNRLEREAILYCANTVKSKFGIDMEFINKQDISAATKWLSRIDKNFDKHVFNPYNNTDDQFINSRFIIHLTKGTYVFVDGSIAIDDRDETHFKLYVYFFGKKSFAYFNSLSKYVSDSRQRNKSHMIYTITGGMEGSLSYWNCTVSPLIPRPMSTLFFANNTKERIINHLDIWKNNKPIYAAHSLTFKTGILLYGKPGTGKSSMASAIANYLDCGLIIIDTTTFQYLNISSVVESINADNRTYVILIDEIDAIFKSRDDKDASDTVKENTTKLLSLLDSPQSPSNVVFVATTNYIDRLDNALIRKGRFDLIEEFGDMDYHSALEMCESFNVKHDDAVKIISKFDGGINPVELQNEILVTFKSNIMEE
jgi:hypothetical protein